MGKNGSEYFQRLLLKMKLLSNLVLGANSLGSDGSIDSHIDLVTYVIRHLSSAIYVSNLSFMTDGMNDR